MTEASRGFLGRWARRKTDALQGKPLDQPVAGALPDTLQAAAPLASAGGSAVSAPSGVAPAAVAPERPQEKLLSLDDVKLLTQESDFKPFMANNVAVEVRNAAMKKLFADPHFNVMDGLDIYIGDYSQSDPIPPSMLRQMAGAKFLNLFDDPEKDAAKGQGAADALEPGAVASLPREGSPDASAEIVAPPCDNQQMADSGQACDKNSATLASLPLADASQPEPTKPNGGRSTS